MCHWCVELVVRIFSLLFFFSFPHGASRRSVYVTNQGLATAPLLYASMECRELQPIIKRRFGNPGTQKRYFTLLAFPLIYGSSNSLFLQAYNLVMSTNGVARAEHLAIFYPSIFTLLNLVFALINSDATFHSFTGHTECTGSAEYFPESEARTALSG